jgi:hypothetical protein
VDRKGVEHDEPELHARAHMQFFARARHEALNGRLSKPRPQERLLQYSTHSRLLSRTGYKSDALSRAHTHGSTSDSPPAPATLIYLFIVYTIYRNLNISVSPAKFSRYYRNSPVRNSLTFAYGTIEGHT